MQSTLSVDTTLTRREVLLDVEATLADTKKLESLAGQNALYDCALYLMAKNDGELLERLNNYVDTDELLCDIEHIRKGMSIRLERKRLEDMYAGIR